MRRLRVILAVQLVALGAMAAYPADAQRLPTQNPANPRYPYRPAGPGMAKTIATDEPDTVPHTLAEALGLAYENNPQLTGERAHLRSVDENVPTALAGWRPVIAIAAPTNLGFNVGKVEERSGCGTRFGGGAVPRGCSPVGPITGTGDSSTQRLAGEQFTTFKDNRSPQNATATITQYLYRGGHTTAATHEAVNSVYAERARLIAEEESVFGDTINAYVNVIEDRQLLKLDRANEQVLGDELRAITDRFKVGELTRTDVAQAQAALAQAIATSQTAQGTLDTADATFVREVGVDPPADLADPQPLALPIKTEAEASRLARLNNPNVIAAKFNESQLRDAVDVAFSALGPNLYLQASGFYSKNASANFNGGQSAIIDRSYGTTATLNLTLPLYQGGQEYAAIRQARQNYLQAVRETEDAQRAAIQQAVQAYETLVAARASIASSHVAVRASEIALEGLEREALVGSATTQEVLIGQQNLLSAEITLVQNVTSLVTASYGIASAIGRLTASDMGLAVPLYDETAYYKQVKDLLWGTGDRAVNQPGR
jgi:outer membrane protein